MILMHAAWLHGHATEVEFPDRIAHEHRAGFYYSVEGRAGTDNWFHLAIPTPVIVSTQRLHVGSVMLRYRTAEGALLTAVHVYDGESRISHADRLENHPDAWGMERYTVPGSPEVKWGVGISFNVRFPRAGARIEIAAAGCDFLGTPAVVARPA